METQLAIKRSHIAALSVSSTSAFTFFCHVKNISPIIIYFRSRSSSLQLGAGEHPGRRPERHNHRGNVGATPRGLRHHHRLVHCHLPEAAGPGPEQEGVQNGRGSGRGRTKMKFPMVSLNLCGGEVGRVAAHCKHENTFRQKSSVNAVLPSLCGAGDESIGWID